MDNKKEHMTTGKTCEIMKNPKTMDKIQENVISPHQQINSDYSLVVLAVELKGTEKDKE